MNLFKKLKLKEEPNFSAPAMAIFIIVFVLAGVYLIYRLFAYANLDILNSGAYNSTTKSIERISGPDRYSTAVGISKKQFYNTTASTVILASGENWPDSAAGSVLAKAYNAPLLLTNATSLNSYTANEITRLRPSRVIILGGTSSVGSGVQTSVKNIVPTATIERFAGTNRYDAAAKIAKRIFDLNGGKINDQTAIVVTGLNFPDILTVGPVAAAKGYPILFVSTSMPAETKNIISTMGIRRTIVVGGTASVPDAVKNQLPGAIRITGANRYDASVNFATWAFNNISGITFKRIGVASGETFPDALAAGSFIAAGELPGLMILSPLEINATIENYIKSKISQISTIYVFGGQNSISNTTYTKLANYLNYGFTSEQVSAQNILQQRINKCPLLSGSSVVVGTVPNGYQAVSYYSSGQILISPTHVASLEQIINHEVYHIYDWRDNNVINWGENVPQPVPDCIP